jgi:hypothetical protein
MEIRSRVEAKKQEGVGCARIYYDWKLIKPLKISTIHLIPAIFFASPIIPDYGKIACMTIFNKSFPWSSWQAFTK